MATVSVHLILYVSRQAAATAFWQVVLDRPPALDVPGMTEFTLGPNVVLGLMPETGIKSLLGPSLPDPAAAHGVPRAELYLVVDDAAAYLGRARAAGATELSPLTRRSWGDDAAYYLDPDGHVVAFATRPSGEQAGFSRQYAARWAEHWKSRPGSAASSAPSWRTLPGSPLSAAWTSGWSP